MNTNFSPETNAALDEYEQWKIKMAYQARKKRRIILAFGIVDALLYAIAVFLNLKVSFSWIDVIANCLSLFILFIALFIVSQRGGAFIDTFFMK